ncbi:MAG: TIGR00270 family protein [Thermoplasmata archaeon]|nr:TIGR00270 family protein [Thermoplasmata archaeon]
MVCELCGKEVRTKLMMVEGAPLNVCEGCQKFAVGEAVVKTETGRVIATPIADRLEMRGRRMGTRDIYSQGSDKMLADDYGARVRDRRRQMSLTQEELAKKINEKKSVIIKVENQDMRPSDKLLGTLERALGISLKEAVEDVDTSTSKEAFKTGMTLGDFIKYE